MDPLSLTTAAITVGTCLKDLVELALKIKESTDKVGENKKHLQELTDDVVRTLDGLVNLTAGNEDVFQAPALFMALGGLQQKMKQVLEGCREIPVATDPSQGRTERFKSRVKRLWNGAEIEAEIKSLQEHTNDCYTKFMLFSTARTEGKIVQIAKSATRIEDRMIGIHERTRQIATSTARIEQGTGQITDSTTRIERGTDQIAERTVQIGDNTAHIQVSALHGKLEKWLQFPPSMAEKQHETQKLHHAGTGEWFLNGDQFREWKGKPRFLWIEGNSGAGKSVLSSVIIRNLFEHRQSAPGGPSSVAYFYFDFRDEKKQLVEVMLRSIILQLSAQSPNDYSALDHLYSSSNGQTLPTYQNLMDVLHELLQEIGHTYIVPDALDECNEPDLIIQLISKLRDQTDSPLHLLFTSQSREMFTAAFKDIPHIVLDLKTTAEDIERFVASELRSKRLKHWARHSVQITTKILEKSNGMFRMAACLLVELSRHIFARDPGPVLESLPTDLFEIYDRFLRPIDPAAFSAVEMVLCWLVCSARTLTLPELEDALAFDFPDEQQNGVFDPNKRGDYAQQVCELLEGLVKVYDLYEDNDIPTLADGSDDGDLDSPRPVTLVVILAHASVAEYLFSRGFAEQHHQYDLNQEHSHKFIAQTCVGYLLHFEHSPLNNETLPNYPLARYAAQYWIHHLKGCQDEAILSISTMHLIQMDSPQYLAFYGKYGNALQSASINGHIGIVRLLVEKGADINATDVIFGNALLAASRRWGNRETVQFLLDNGADMNSVSRRYGSALQAASACGDTEIAGLLIEKGADVNIRNGIYGCALETALESWNTQDGIYDSAMEIRSKNLNTDIVRLLLNKAADLNAIGGELVQRTFHGACASGDTEIVLLLLEKRVDVSTTEEVGTALQAACSNDTIEIVQLLLENGADVNTAGGYGGTALQAACSNGIIELVRLLIQKGADVNAAGERGTALQRACKEGHTDVVRLLLANGADLNAAGERGTALQAACSNGTIELVRLLIQERADVNAAGERDTALQTACKEGHTDVVRLLLANGADVNAQGGIYGTALQATAGIPGLYIEELTSPGYDYGQRWANSWTLPNAAVHKAANACKAADARKTEIIRLLLENAADVNERTGIHALQKATKAGYTQVVQILVDNGAYVEAEDLEKEVNYRWGHRWM
ncbi:ankyrin repeat-containing domain protein [Mycena vulgaris]|nr:ankyrin repeat-containing domain protein [Mycena vulgaris]